MALVLRALTKPSVSSVFQTSIRTAFWKRSNRMSQVEVDEAHVQANLGAHQMKYVRTAEEINKKRAEKHREDRKGALMIGGSCVFIAVSIYLYTFYAMKQETFLDDFEVPPDPIADANAEAKAQMEALIRAKEEALEKAKREAAKRAN